MWRLLATAGRNEPYASFFFPNTEVLAHSDRSKNPDENSRSQEQG